MAHNNWVKPTDTTRTTGCCPILMANFTDPVTHFIKEFCREWAISNTAGIGFTYTDNLINLAWANTWSDGHPTCDWVWRGYKWIGSLVDIQHNPLGSFKEHALAIVQSIVQDDRSIGYILLDLLTIFIVFFEDIVKWKSLCIIEFGKLTVLFFQIDAKAFRKDVTVQKIRDPDSHTRSLVHVGWSNPFDGRSDFVFAFRLFLETVQFDVVRKDDMGTVRDAKAVRWYPFFMEISQLLD